jgi:MbtH protein
LPESGAIRGGTFRSRKGTWSAVNEGSSMIANGTLENATYKVVVNHEAQYSIWLAEKENPLGWTDVGKSGTKTDCLTYITEVWTDMRPLTLRTKLAEREQ